MSACPTGFLHRVLLWTRRVSACWLCLGLAAVHAADAPGQDLTVAPPASFSEERLIAVNVSPDSALRYGIDPATVSVGSDGVVRYVLVARSPSGALNVLFEGIRCQTAEMKSYARWNNASAWNMSAAPEWRPLRFSGPTRHSMVLARSGVCDGNTPHGDAAKILKNLKGGEPLPR